MPSLRVRRVLRWTVALWCLSIAFHKARGAWRRRRTPKSEQRTLLFTGGGLLWAFYMGVATAIEHNFHVYNVRCIGISAGCLPSSQLALELVGNDEESRIGARSPLLHFPAEFSHNLPIG